MKIKRILFPTDFTEKSDKAREHAMYLADVLSAQVYVLHAIEPFDYDEMDEEIMSFYTEIENQLKQKMEREKELFNQKGLSVKDDIIIGQRWRVINAYAKDNQMDMIVMGSHGIKTKSGEVSVGTTSHKVMFTSPCPVLLVRNEDR